MGLLDDHSGDEQREGALVLDASSSLDENKEPPQVKTGRAYNKRKADNIKQGATKRLKTDPNDKATKSLLADTLFGCTDVVSVIFSFLEIRQLLRFVCVSKNFKSRLTYHHVVRSTMLSGGFPLTSLEFMVSPIRLRKIWIPSPIRLLRTVCGKRCESCLNQNRFVCDSFGLFYCKKCTNASTKLFRRTKKWKEYLDAPRVSLGPRKGSTGKSSMYLMLEPLKDPAGNAIGPLVTAQDLETMASDESSQTPKERMTAWIQKCDDQQPNADAAVKAILKALNDNHKDANNRRDSIWKEKIKARTQLGATRRQKSDELVANLAELLQGEDPDIVTQVNTKIWSNRENQYVFPRHTIFKKLLAPVFKAPSQYKATKKLKDVANQLVLVWGEKKLMDMYIQRIIDHCDHPDADDNVLRRIFNTSGLRYNFLNPVIRDILKEPFSKPLELNDEIVQQLADQVKTIAQRRAPGEAVLQKLEEELNDFGCVQDLRKRSWSSWNWSWMFAETYVQEILYEAISKPHDISDERLKELENELRPVMEKKMRIQNRMELLLAPIVEQYPEWYTRKLERWRWNPKDNICCFWDFRVRHILGDKRELKNVEEMDDAEIGKLSNHILTNIAQVENRSS